MKFCASFLRGFPVATMSDGKFKYTPFVTGIMTARNPHLSEPDMEGEYADGKYKTEATADEDYTKRFKAEI